MVMNELALLVWVGGVVHGILGPDFDEDQILGDAVRREALSHKTGQK
jgi:hypothetical protein